MADTSFWQAVEALNPEADFVEQHRHSRRVVKRASEQIELEPIRIALLASSTVDHFIEILRAYLMRDGYKPDFFVAEFNTIFQAALHPDSDLYAFEPDLIWIFTNYRDLNFRIETVTNPDAQETDIDDALAQFRTLWGALKANATARIVQNNAERPEERILGNYEVRHDGSLSQRISRFNDRLSQTSPAEVQIFDIARLADNTGLARWHDRQYWYHSKHAFAPDATGLVAHAGARLIRGLMGRAYKCAILDLDNTMWGGVIGDDGLGGIKLGQGDPDGEAFVDFQHYIKALKSRGIILAVCSKNDEANATEVFESHPEMVLSLDDISVFVCNWNNKAENIRMIANTLEIGLDSIVFVDDNPAERALVRELLPMVAVPELPEDPALYCSTLDREAYFELATFSNEDRKRSAMYRDNAQRKVLETQITDVKSFLKNLDMECIAGEVDEFTLPRVVQLINKSNQFHLTTTRYNDQRVIEMMNNPNFDCLYFKLADRFGDNGLISAIILEQRGDVFRVDTWVMSCRVLSRGMEDLIHNKILDVALHRGAKYTEGNYIRTLKNNLVAELYKRLGWTPVTESDEISVWKLPTDPALRRQHQIKRTLDE